MDTTNQAELAQARAARREKMLSKIAALRAKTEAQGASEHEAMSAAAVAARLMDEWGVTEDDLAAMRERPTHAWTKGAAGMANRSDSHKVQFCAIYIARLTGTRCVFAHRALNGLYQRVAEYFGEAPDVEMACWLHDTLRNALDAEYASYRRSRGRVGQGAKAAFQAGMVSRLNERMQQLVEERRARSGETTGRELVVCKQRLVQAAWKEAYPHMRSSRSRLSYNAGQSAYGAGHAAGGRVGLGRPVGDQGTSRALRIGRQG